MRALHPSLDHLRAFADGDEPESAASRRAAAHLRDCAACRAEVTGIRERRAQLRAATTIVPPPQAWERILARREAGEEAILPSGPVPLPAPEPARETGSRGSILRRAAVLLVGVAGIASATVPGSPVRAWLGDVFRPTPAEAPAAPAAADSADSARAVDSVVAAPTAARAPEAGIAVLPAAGEVRVVVTEADPALRIRVRLTEAGRAEVRGRGAAAEAAFASGRGRITVRGAAGGGELEVLLPRSATRASLTVDGRRYVVLEGGRMTVLVPADSSGAEIVFPGRP